MSINEYTSISAEEAIETLEERGYSTEEVDKDLEFNVSISFLVDDVNLNSQGILKAVVAAEINEFLADGSYSAMETVDLANCFEANGFIGRLMYYCLRLEGRDFKFPDLTEVFEAVSLRSNEYVFTQVDQRVAPPENGYKEMKIYGAATIGLTETITIRPEDESIDRGEANRLLREKVDNLSGELLREELQVSTDEIV